MWWCLLHPKSVFMFLLRPCFRGTSLYISSLLFSRVCFSFFFFECTFLTGEDPSSETGTLITLQHPVTVIDRVPSGKRNSCWFSRTLPRLSASKLLDPVPVPFVSLCYISPRTFGNFWKSFYLVQVKFDQSWLYWNVWTPLEGKISSVFPWYPTKWRKFSFLITS